ncbi:MAG: hypothetical protein K9N46_07500 [Candidatus Marinimicrobia bacterium]|nr:hypothetical protein [Candidatus Neomarinimicrobiota bacterium]MCF7880568.1 hypothetical protein [Candidatus Neomarinimicrobiota bacterium]
MGRALLLIVLGLMVASAIAQMSFQDRQQMLLDRSATYARDAETRNLANSGLEIALKELADDNSWRTGISNLSIGNGTVNVTVDDESTNPQLLANQVQITSVADIDGESSQVRGTLEFDGGIPPIPAPMGIYSNNITFNMSGNSILIDGNDTNADGSAGPEDGVPGLTVGGQAAEDSIYSTLTSSQLNNIRGPNGSPSIEQSPGDNSDLQGYIDTYTTYADTVISSDLNSTTIGTPGNPMISVVNGDVHISSVHGAGVLVVTEGNSIRITGDFNYKGLIILQGNTNFEADIYGNTNINGAILFSSTDPTANFDLDLRGNVNMIYGSQSLVKLEKELSDQIDSELRQVSRYE